MRLVAPRRLVIVRCMMDWIARLFFPRLDKVRRGREIRLLLVTVLLSLLACAALAGMIYYFSIRHQPASPME